MRHLLSNSYRMWALRLIVVLAAVGGGLTWWTLSGGDAITIEAVQESCHKSSAVEDVDVLMYSQLYEDGKMIHELTEYVYISGKNTHIVTEASDYKGHHYEKSDDLFLDGDVYFRTGDEDWRKVTSEYPSLNEPPFPLNLEAICPKLENFTFAKVEDVAGQSAKKVTAPTLSGEPYDKPVDYGDPEQTRDWEIWVDGRGYILKMAATTYSFPGSPSAPAYVSYYELTYSGHGEPNILPNPKE